MLQFGFDTKLLPPALDEFLGDLTHGVRRSLEKDLERNAVSLSHAVAVRIYDPRIVENLSRARSMFWTRHSSLLADTWAGGVGQTLHVGRPASSP